MLYVHQDPSDILENDDVENWHLLSRIRRFSEVTGLPAPLMLISSWFVLFVAIPKLVWMVLVPSWYLLPPTGQSFAVSWARSVQDHLRDTSLNLLPGTVLIGISMALFVSRARYTGRLDRLAIGFAAVNAFSLPLGYLLILLLNMVSMWLFSGEPNTTDNLYREMALPAAALVTVFGILLLAQWRLPFDQE